MPFNEYSHFGGYRHHKYRCVQNPCPFRRFKNEKNTYKKPLADRCDKKHSDCCKKTFKRWSDRTTVTDEKCGTFDTNLPTPIPLTIYSIDETVFPSGTVSVYYGRGTPSTVTVTVTQSNATTQTLTIPQGNTISQTFGDIVSVSIDTAEVTGKYCLTIHYTH
ncbi:S-Ena type endospore appendage [Shouchella shacheensis]|uniref:S-Ena type endospore appendage n=1 Tax=Shouchella shacheensis TaxID=1649580 RepID=UPI000B1C4AF7|nr:S-Ena type endospore appendage [Shouchella shacheensis]